MKSKILGLVAVGLLAGPITASALIIDTTGGTETFTFGWTGSAQTFIAPSEDVLQSWTFFLAPRDGGGSVQFSIFEWSGDAPTGTALFTTALDWAASGGATGTSGMNLQLTSGMLYGAVIDFLGFGGSSLVYTGDRYAGGNGLWTFTPPLTGYDDFAELDHVFIAEFSDSTSVPEPGTLALLGLGLAGLGLSRRRRAN